MHLSGQQQLERGGAAQGQSPQASERASALGAAGRGGGGLGAGTGVRAPSWGRDFRKRRVGARVEAAVLSLAVSELGTCAPQDLNPA